MSNESYVVLELPKENQESDSLLTDASFYDDFDKAFDCFNERVSTESQQIFKQPKSPQPLRASLSHFDVELWVIKRTNNLSKQ